MKYIVYLTINLKNNKIYIGVHKCEDPSIFDGYIGCGIRINIPSSYNKPKTALLYAVNKYGTSLFRRTILKICSTELDAYKLEELLVDLDFITRADTYNSKLGGQGGNSNYVRVNQFDLNGKLVKHWNSIIEASEFYNISHTAILNAMRFKGSSIKYFWSKDSSININEYSINLGSICYKYDATNGKYITLYNSTIEAAKDNNVSFYEIQRSIKSGYRVRDSYYSLTLLEEYNGKPNISLKYRPIYVYTLSGEYITELTNKSLILEFFNISNLNPIQIALKANRPYKEYQISLTKLDHLEPKLNKRNICKEVGRYSLVGELLETYDSITKAVAIYGTGVLKVLRGQQKQCKDFIFKYIS